MSQCTDILNHLEKGRSITAVEAMMDFGCMRLAARIAELRQSGHPISTEMISVKRRGGEAAIIAVYSL